MNKTRHIILFACALAAFACAEDSVQTAVDDADVEHVAVDCEEYDPMQTSNLAFKERLAEVMRTCDVYPWIEVLKLGPAPTNPMPPVVPYMFPNASWKRSYSLLIREFALLANSVYSPMMNTEVATLAVDFAYEVDNVRQSSIPLLSRAAVGDVETGWHPIADGGLYLPKQKQISFEVTTRGQTLNQGYVYVAARGYRLFPKGMISPVQLSLDEHRHAGMRPVPFTYAVKIDLTAPSEAFAAKLLVGDDFLATGIRTSGRGHGHDAVPPVSGVSVQGFGPMLELKVGTDRPMMSGAASRFVVAGNSRNNAWDFDHPVTISGGTEIDIEATIPTVAGVTGAEVTAADPLELEVLVEGFKLVRGQ